MAFDNGTRIVSVSRNRLLDTLRENLVKHEAEYKEAKKGYLLARSEKTSELAKAAAAAASDDSKENREALKDAWNNLVGLDKPTNHSPDYEQAIALVEWEVRDTVDLTTSEFEKYVRDNWHWVSAFKTSLVNYTTPR